MMVINRILLCEAGIYHEYFSKEGTLSVQKLVKFFIILYFKFFIYLTIYFIAIKPAIITATSIICYAITSTYFSFYGKWFNNKKINSSQF